MERRDFLKTASIAGLTFAGTGMTGPSDAAEMNDGKGKLPKRPLGKTGIHLSIIGFGGIVVMNVEQDHADQVVAEAVERGVNYFDVAPTYGNAEERLGPALEPFRKDVFLACKTTQRDEEGSAKELQASLKKMRTDHFDLYQLHALSKLEDLDQASGKGGALETFVKARDEGLTRLIGFSAHSAEVALAAMDRFDFDTILFPFNYVTWHQGNFGPQVYAKAKEKGVARLALKALARQSWPKGADRSQFGKCWYQPVSDPIEAGLALRFTLSKDITAAIPPGEESLFRLALEIADRFKPLEKEEEEKVRQLASGLHPIFSRTA
ncbi:MAG: aldo/keto reductase [Candidatus Omnitrophota bacterium]|jgi:predicted aldo/keto reductase-like oxidoreductase|nr:MAG: aldo/keto reductase [Candidatus Omnitrophota bacterium]